MASRHTLREQLQTLQTRKGMTQVRIAELLGVSERTVRRWKNEGVQPSKDHHASTQILSREAAKVRREIIRQSVEFKDRDATRKIDIVKPIRPKVDRFLVPATRRKLRDKMIGYKRVKRKDKKTGKYKKVDREIWTYKLSDYVMYDVRVLNLQEQAEFILALLQDGNSVQLVFRTETYGDKSRFMTTSPIDPERGEGKSARELLSELKNASAEGFGRSKSGKAARIIATPRARGGRHYK